MSDDVRSQIEALKELIAALQANPDLSSITPEGLANAQEQLAAMEAQRSKEFGHAMLNVSHAAVDIQYGFGGVPNVPKNEE